MESSNISHIRRKYGAGNLRKYMKYSQAGIPEVYWQCKIPTDMKINLIKHNEGTTIFNILSFQDDVSTKYLATLAKEVVRGDASVKYVDFYQFIADIGKGYSMFNADAVQTYSRHDLVVITGVSFGDSYEKVSEPFVLAIKSIHDTTKSKSIFIQLEGVEPDKFTEAYGALYAKHLVDPEYAKVFKVSKSKFSEIGQIE